MFKKFARNQVLWVLSCLCILAFPPASFASSTPQPITLDPLPPSSEVLTIISPDGTEHAYNTAALEALDAHLIVQDSQWHGENSAFSGVLLSNLLDMHGLGEADAIRVVAEDDYAVTFSREGIAETPILVATRINDQPMTRRARGPFFFVIDHDAVRQARHLGEHHHVWYARIIRAVTPDEL